MKNRAKCKLCNEILESFHRYDYVSCKCGEISINGGNDTFECSAKNWGNFLRVDDKGNEILVKIVENPDEKSEKMDESPKMGNDSKLEMLQQMLKNIENLPQKALELPINHYDFYSFMLIVLEILKSDKK